MRVTRGVVPAGGRWGVSVPTAPYGDAGARIDGRSGFPEQAVQFGDERRGRQNLDAVIRDASPRLEADDDPPGTGMIPVQVS
ncbi:MAG: hypothetical protein ABIP90_03610, partial [Vicinamibacterales bacterium]